MYKSIISDQEWAEYVFFIDEIRQSPILDSALEKKFGVTDTTSNDTIELLIPPQKRYFSDSTGIKYSYIACVTILNKEEIIPLLDNKGKINKDFIQLINETSSKEGYVHSILNKDVIEYCKDYGIQDNIYEHIKKQLYIEGINFE